MNSKKIVLTQTRINYIDFLRFIGLTGIIIAHVGSPKWAIMLRSFDVPFMVILSSVLGEKSYHKFENSKLSPMNYFFSRIKRLVIPTWILLIIYFGILYIISGNFFEFNYYIASFCLTRYGIGYVWIILIYLYSALLIPLFSKIKLSKMGMVCVTIIYLMYEVAYYFQIGVDNKLIDSTFYYIIPYGLLTYLGYNYYQIKKNNRCIIAIVSLIVFISFGVYYWYIYEAPQIVQIAKYPPRFYYLGYGIAVSFGLLLFCEKYYLKIYDNPLIRYISVHSMWIYLWHILILTAYGALKLPEIWYIKLIIVYAIAIAIIYVVNRFLDIIENKRKFKFFKYLRG